MNLSVRDVSKLFNASEKTIYGWIQAERLPHYQVSGQYRFDYSELLEWSALRGLRLNPDSLKATEKTEGRPISIADALEEGGIYDRVESDSKEAVLKAISRLMKLPKGTDRGLFSQFLLAREKLGSTAIGDGIAVPHVRNPLVLNSEMPSLALFFLESPVDFGAMDGKPVSIVFSMISPNIKSHLQMLSRLMFLLKNDALTGLLHAGASLEEILRAFRTAEEGFLPPRTAALPHREPRGTE
ncbi:MAG: PTS sugar transporter subunit IIA [Spirochaetes bacterium]|nr:PTS sugar transporter subunit IIA [Spirochaetota bacterium]